MTIISAVIKQNFIVVASDSLLVRKKDGKSEVNKDSYSGNPKFVAFPKLKCIASYWGLASIILEEDEVVWKTYDWLYSKVNIQDQFDSIESFGEHLKNELTSVLKKYSWSEYKMLGIHLTGFEYFNNKWIPELFLIIGDSNSWNFTFSRRTYWDLTNGKDLEVDLLRQREIYYEVLQKGYSIYNNGDNEMFNNFFNSFHYAVKSIDEKRQLSGGLSKKLFIDLASIPIKQVAYFQNKYYIKDSIKVAGRVHTILMNSDGRVESYSSK